jgi:hypothetical protein
LLQRLRSMEALTQSLEPTLFAYIGAAESRTLSKQSREVGSFWHLFSLHHQLAVFDLHGADSVGEFQAIALLGEFFL